MNRTSLSRASLGAGALVFLVDSTAISAPVWVGDLETGDLSQWSYVLYEDHITVVDDPVVQGAQSARIELRDDAVWPNNGLRRVELNHRPEDARTAEGATTYFAWSFLLPETLPESPTAQIGYWESDQSYQQMMAFNVIGTRMEFITQRPTYVVQWNAENTATPGVWHRIAMGITWSKQAANGRVNLWFDGVQVVTNLAVQTLADDNPHFTQVGLLRGNVDFDDEPVIMIDDAVEGDTLADVHPELTAEGGSGGAGAGAGGAGGVGGVGGAGASGGAGSGAGETGSGASGSGDGSGGSAETEDGCVVASTSRASSWVGGLVLLALVGSRRPRRRAGSA